MQNISLSAAQALALSSPNNVTLHNLQETVSERLRDVRLASDFWWQLKPLGNSDEDHEWQGGPVGKGWRKIDIDYSDVDFLRRYRRPVIRIFFKDLVCNAEDTKLVVKCIRHLFLDAFVKYRTHLRRRIVVLTSDPGDPNSFNHKALNVLIQEGLCDLGSMFLLDPENEFLALSATTGLKSALPKKDVFYTLDDKSWVRRSFATPDIYVEHDAGGPIVENKFGEETRGAPIVSRLFLPLTLQENNAGAYQRWPVSGVFRLLRTPKQRAGAIMWPRYFTWVDTYFLDFVGEVMHVILQGYLSSWWAHSLIEKIVHGIKAGVDGSLEQVKIAQLFLFPNRDNGARALLPSDWAQRSFAREQVEKLLQNAEFFLLDASEQVTIVTDGTLEGTTSDSTYRTRVIARLFADVLQKAVNLAPRIAFVNNAKEPPQISNLKKAGATLLPPVFGDDGLVLSVFRNLIENAVKYAKPGTRAQIEISFETSDSHVCVVVQDDGIGIPRGEEKSLFTRGFRGRQARDTTLKGRGIGLAYCKAIMGLMGGDLEFRQSARGACFVVTLKRADAVHTGGGVGE